MVTFEESTEPVAALEAEGLAEAFASLPAALGLADALAACASWRAFRRSAAARLPSSTDCWAVVIAGAVCTARPVEAAATTAARATETGRNLVREDWKAATARLALPRKP